MHHVILRPYAAGDFKALAHLINSTWDFQSLGGRRLAGRLCPHYLLECLAFQSFVCVAEIDGQAAGVIMACKGLDPHTPLWIRGKMVQAKRALNVSSLGRNASAVFNGLQEVYLKLLDEHGLCDGQIAFFALDKGAHGQGVGKKLFNAALGYLKSVGCKDFFLFSDNACSFGFYEHQGMQRSGCVQHTLNFRGGAQELEVYLYTAKLEGMDGGRR